MSRPEWIEVGRISRPHGVHGEVRVMPSSDNPERFAPGSVLYARPERLGIAGAAPAGAGAADHRDRPGRWTASPSWPSVEVADRDAAEALRGHVLEIRSSQLPELDEDEYYPFDLIGLEARDLEGAVVGRVTDVVESPAHALLVVSSGPGVGDHDPLRAGGRAHRGGGRRLCGDQSRLSRRCRRACRGRRRAATAEP